MIITRAGFLTSVQDLGRSGYREFGVSSGGALDSFALRVANLLDSKLRSAVCDCALTKSKSSPGAEAKSMCTLDRWHCRRATRLSCLPVKN